MAQESARSSSVSSVTMIFALVKHIVGGELSVDFAVAES
jgi:hypothetical protein